DGVHLIVSGGFLFTCHQKLSTVILNIGDAARHWRAVHMHVEHIKKNADPGAAIFRSHDNDFAVGRSNGVGSIRDLAVRIAEEIEKKKRKNKERDSEYGTGQVRDEKPACSQS